MANISQKYIDIAKKNYPNEPEFLQTVEEVLLSIEPVLEAHPEYEKAGLVKRLIEPERMISFRVPWVDDNGEVQVNRGYRVQFNSALGPYKGGLRFQANVYPGILKFLGFEQIFKNSLTGLPIGGGKGGSDFDPAGKSDAEVMRFCQSFATELYRHIGPNIDVPAGDMGVGGREIGYMMGQYKRITKEYDGTWTGKGTTNGGLNGRTEATGFGIVFFAREVLKHFGDSLEGKTAVVSGFGNVSWGTITKLVELGAKPITISGPDGYILDEEGITTPEKIDTLLELRNSGKNVCAPYVEKFPNAKFIPGKRPWEVKCDIAFPCATQNELHLEDAKKLVENGVICVTEAANMPSTLDAINYFLENKILFSPGKASNAGGVATSGLEMTQNSIRLGWSEEEVDAKLKNIMVGIHNACVEYGKEEGGFVNYVKGANIAGFVKVADAMIAQGIV